MLRISTSKFLHRKYFHMPFKMACLGFYLICLIVICRESMATCQFLSQCENACYRKKFKERARYSDSHCVNGASRGSCVLGDHYCNEGSMAATLAGPQAALYNSCSAERLTLIKALLHNSPVLPKYGEITMTYLRRPDPK